MKIIRSKIAHLRDAARVQQVVHLFLCGSGIRLLTFKSKMILRALDASLI